MWPASCFTVVLLACSAAAEHVQVSELDAANETNTRIIGGTPTTITRYPYTVQVLFSSQFSCGGTLLTRRHVLSAAHCFVDPEGRPVPPRYFSVRVGSTYLNSGGSVHSVSAVVTHERYNVPPRDNDVAVLVLATNVRLTSSVALAYIPVPHAVVPDNVTVVQVGWGRTSTLPEASASTVLNAVQIRKVNRNVCASRYSYLQAVTGQAFVVTDNMLCAGLLDVGGKDACQGDSGGPMIYSGVVVGITSWGWGCAEPQYPGVSARVAKYTPWIKNVVGGVQSKLPNSAHAHSSASYVISVILVVSINF